MRRLGTKSIGLIFQHIQHRAVYRNRCAYFGRQRVEGAQMSNGNNLPRGVLMVFLGGRMRVHNHYPIHNVNVGKCCDAYLIR
jgi:hypothetical protein